MDDALFFTTKDAFSEWLTANSDAKELWVGYYRKSTGRPSLSWSDSVDVALCFGWIDGVRHSIDDQSYKIRFTPRKSNSVWSAVNVKKVKELIQSGKMKPAGLHVFSNRSDKQGYTSDDRNVPLSQDFEALVKANPQAWQFLTNLAPSNRRDSIWWVMSAKKEETRLKRLGVLIASSEAGLKIPSLRKK
ncbi:MAG: YdeI/OmpD-associated family protein [Pelagimonas sp.]|uniref:YdeI/OmpD-associated family protein n=1 Tax=Pelagimonas sp. TaxID=2073170 RepID=UPI003D6AE930